VSLNRWAKDFNAPLLVADKGGLAVAATTTGMDPQQLSTGQPLVWVGETLASRLGLADLRTPQTILIKQRPFTVAGVIHARAGFEYIDTSLVVGREPGTAMIPAGRTVRVIAGIRPGAAVAVADYALAALDPTKTLTLRDVTPPDGELLLGNVAADLKLIGLALGGFVGLIGTITVANTMSMSVVQRTRELGLRSAMGWTPARIRTLILLESGASGLFAAVIGSTLGTAVAITWAGINAWQPIISKPLPAIVILAGTAAAIIGGLIPAHHASRVSPLAAMRS
jgi:putative ABC transport system permease protein